MKREDDLDNFLAAAMPGGIEAQEARGQREFVRSEELPKEWGMGKSSAEMLTKLGIKVLGDADDLFYRVELPAGWSKVRTDHSMWSDLVDDKGRKRAGLFYKAAFYDRKAHIHFNTRHKADHEPEGGWDAPQDKEVKERFVGIVRDDGKEIWRSERLGYTESIDQARAKMLEMFPDAEDFLAYWD